MRYGFKSGYIRLTILIASLIAIAGCKEQTISSDPSLRLTFSTDSICFDTVFTGIGSSTRTVMIYNRNKNAVVIDNITTSGQWFRLNIDGENDPDRLKDITINGGDSLYMFVKVKVEERNSNMPVMIEDTIRFITNGNRQHIALQAVGIDVEMIRSGNKSTVIEEDFTFNNTKPYLIYDTVRIKGQTTIAAGATLYMHQGSNLMLEGGVRARGHKDQPIRITGDRLDKLFEKVPYQVASGQWGGIYLIQPKDGTLHNDTLDHIEVLSGNIGLYCSSEQTTTLPSLSLSNSRIHNHAAYGIVLQNTDAQIWNTEISNCASYCVFIEGGTHTLTHNTIASYFGWPYTNINIHNVKREDVAALYINNFADAPNSTTVNIRNCIITGGRDNCVETAQALDEGYNGEIYGNYLKADSIQTPLSHDNTYAQDSDKVFKNINYKYKEYVYYDFRLDSLSVARCIGDSLLALQDEYATDRTGIIRKGKKPDAGCYQTNDE